MANQDMSSLKERLRVFRQREIIGAVLALVGLAIFAINIISPIRNSIVTLVLPITVLGLFGFVFYERECMALKIAIENNTQAYAMY